MIIGGLYGNSVNNVDFLTVKINQVSWAAVSNRVNVETCNVFLAINKE